MSDEISIKSVRLRRSYSNLIVSVKVGEAWTDVLTVYDDVTDERADAQEIRRLIAVHHDY